MKFTILMTLSMTLFFAATPTLAICCKDDITGQCQAVPMLYCPGGSTTADCWPHLVGEMALNEEPAAKRGGRKSLEGDEQDQA